MVLQTQTAPESEVIIGLNCMLPEDHYLGWVAVECVNVDLEKDRTVSGLVSAKESSGSATEQHGSVSRQC